MRIRKLALSAAVIFVSSICIVAIYKGPDALKEAMGLQSKSTGAIWSQFVCRVDLNLEKLRGGRVELSQISWSELWSLTRPGIPFHCDESTSLEAALLYSSRASDADRAAGGRIFHERCTGCHGNDASGGLQGPSLIRPSLAHGDSDLAMYRTLSNGVPGTAMPPAGLLTQQALQVIAYLKGLQAGVLVGKQAEPASHPAIQVDGDRLRTAGTRSDEWLTYSGSYDGRRYSALAEITPDNVGKLRVRWVTQFPNDIPGSEATPLVIDDVIFMVMSPSHIAALDAATGNIIWNYHRPIPSGLSLCCGPVNRGLAVYGDTLFFDSLDGYLIAINANDGTVKWQTEVAKASDGYSLTGAPLVVDRSVVVGVAGGEFGIRGFLAAFDVMTGHQKWTFSTVPGPGEFGHDTWPENAWRTGGGPTWNIGSYDPDADLLYWGVGNPSPNFASHQRPGDNLFTDSVIALHASTGRLAWYFQFTPHDEHDWDSTQVPVLTTLTINGVSRKVICWANRNGFYYILDRLTGQYLAGVPFVEVNWAQGLSPTGRPILSDVTQITTQGRSTMPGVSGGTNWQSPAFDESRDSIFIPATESTTVFTHLPNNEVITRRPGQFFVGSGVSETVPPKRSVIALDATSGQRKWQYKITPDAGDCGSLLATSGGLVLGSSGGVIFALNEGSGQEVWRLPLGGPTRSGVISFAVDGRQVIVVTAGQDIFEFGL